MGTQLKMIIDYIAEQKQSIGLLINYSSMSEISATKKNLSVFSLLRTKKDCYYPPVHSDYTPLKGSNQTEQTILPKFNLDSNFFTPAFINPYENARLRQNSVEALDREREKFLKKIETCDHSIRDENPLFNPRDDNYCSLCKMGFKCYWAHVNSKAHIKRIKTNKFNDYIHELCKKMSSPAGDEPEEVTSMGTEVTKKKKIFKRPKNVKMVRERQVFRKEDFIIKLPSDLFEKEVQNINYNISTNGFNSMEQNLLKM